MPSTLRRDLAVVDRAQRAAGRAGDQVDRDQRAEHQSVTPEIQYQVTGPRAGASRTARSRGTGMPFGPPVQRASLMNTMAMSRPMPSVAMAR